MRANTPRLSRGAGSVSNTPTWASMTRTAVAAGFRFAMAADIATQHAGKCESMGRSFQYMQGS
jgi:hypothetical protein